MSWDEIKPLTDYIRQHGIIQLIHLWKRLKDRQHDVLLWGDEVRRRVFLQRWMLPRLLTAVKAASIQHHSL
jgi:hypothetical protein